MANYLDKEAQSRFYRFGTNSRVAASGRVYEPQQVAIGNEVLIRGHFWLNIVPNPAGSVPRIVIGDGFESGPGLALSAVGRLEVEQNVWLGPNVNVSDTDHRHDDIGLPVSAQGITLTDGRVHVGEGTRIGANSVILGNVNIGKWCVVLPGSVVESDIPDACVAGGAPARLIRVYDPVSGVWVEVRSSEEAEEALRRRHEQPLLSVCISTYDRPAVLEACLASLFRQVGNSGLIEVIVCGNGSADDTSAVVSRYLEQYGNLQYCRCDGFPDAERNLEHAGAAAKGTFIMLNRDDDHFAQGSVARLLAALHSHPDCAIIYAGRDGGNQSVRVVEGVDACLAAASTEENSLRRKIMRRRDWERAIRRQMPEHPDWRCEMLSRNPKICMIG